MESGSRRLRRQVVAFTLLVPGTVVVVVPVLLILALGAGLGFGFARIAGIPALAAGAALLLAGIRQFYTEGEGSPMLFVASRTRGLLGEEPAGLVGGGLYARSRNPMYTGAVLAVAGLGLLLDSLAVLAWAGILLVTFHLVIVHVEEPHLRRKHGDAYTAYLAATPRWLGPRRHLLPVTISPDVIPVKDRLDARAIDMAWKLGLLTTTERAVLVRIDGSTTVDGLGLDGAAMEALRGLVRKRVVRLLGKKEEH